MLNDNEKEILSVMNDKKLLEELKINQEDIKKCVIMATTELKELENIIEKSNQEKENFENLYKQLGGHNLWLEQTYPSHNRFDLNYKSLLITVQQNLDKNNQQSNISLQKSDVYIYPDNICNNAADYLLVLDFEKEIDFEKINQYMDKPREEISFHDFEFDTPPVSNPIQENSGVLRFYCDLELSEPLIEKLHIKDKLGTNSDKYEISVDLNVLQSNGNIRICIKQVDKLNIETFQLTEKEYSEIAKYAQNYISHEWRDFNPFNRKLSLTEFYIVKVLYEEHFENDPRISCEDCFVLAEGINKINEYYKSSKDNIKIHEIINDFVAELKSGVTLNKEEFLKLSESELIRQFEILDLIHGENKEEPKIREDVVVVNYEKIENGKKDVQQLLKKIFDSYEDIKKLNIDRIDYKKSIYNHQELLNSEISNSDYSDLLGCMLDIQDDFMEVKGYMENTLNEIDIFKGKYINEPDVIQEEECEENY